MTGDWGDVAGVLRPSSIGFDVPGKPTPKRSNLSSPTDSYSILSGTSVARGMARVASSFAPTAFGADPNAKVPKIYSTSAAHYTPVFDRSSDGLSLGSGSALKAGFSVGSLVSMAPPPEDCLKTMDLEDDGDLSDAPGLKPGGAIGVKAPRNSFATVGVGGPTACRAIKRLQKKKKKKKKRFAGFGICAVAVDD